MSHRRVGAVALVWPLLFGCHLLLPYGAVNSGPAADAARDHALEAGAARRDVDGPEVLRRPISEADLGRAWAGAFVHCVQKNGNRTAELIPIADKNAVFFVSSPAALTEPPETVKWAGAAWVLIHWDPNACEYEDPDSQSERDNDWGSAGLLVRNASLVDGRLLLGQGAGIGDMNLVDCGSRTASDAGVSFAKVKREIALPDDSTLGVEYPQWVQPIRVAKQCLLELASGAALCSSSASSSGGG